jgi:hypothetical protein
MKSRSHRDTDDPGRALGATSPEAPGRPLALSALRVEGIGPEPRLCPLTRLCAGAACAGA